MVLPVAAVMVTSGAIGNGPSDASTESVGSSGGVLSYMIVAEYTSDTFAEPFAFQLYFTYTVCEPVPESA